MTSAPLAPPRLLTPEEFEELEDYVRYELIDGELRERNLSSYSSEIATEVNGILRNFVRPAKLGILGGPDGGLQIFPDRPTKVVFADGYFISRERLPARSPRTGWLKVAPDLVFEVVSPNDKAEEIHDKVRDYLEAGVDVVWVVYPRSKSVTVHHADGTALSITAQGTITGGTVLPGFEAHVSDFFPDDE